MDWQLHSQPLDKKIPKGHFAKCIWYKMLWEDEQQLQIYIGEQ